MLILKKGQEESAAIALTNYPYRCSNARISNQKMLITQRIVLLRLVECMCVLKDLPGIKNFLKSTVNGNLEK